MDSKMRILARDRRTAAVHEAGHVIAARCVGWEVISAWIERNGCRAAEESGWAEDRSWIGSVRCIDWQNADENSRRFVAVAGPVAEHLWGGESIEEFPFDCLSQSDWRLANCEPNEPNEFLIDAVERAGQLFERHGEGWQALLLESRRLIYESRL
jgi:hypothetical protein